MSWLLSALNSTIGAKILVALTGLMMVGFVLGHLTGNLLVFSGPKAINDYAKMLHDLGPLLWGARLGLLGAIALHIYLTIMLANRNRSARPVEYVRKQWSAASFTSRWMIQSGLLVLCFIVYHLLHFTLGVTNPSEHASVLLISDPARGPVGYPDVHAMVVLGFGNLLVSCVYIVAMVLLGLHLSHGISSMFQTLGIDHPRFNAILRNLGPVLAAAVVAGYVSIPASVLLGLIH